MGMGLGRDEVVVQNARWKGFGLAFSWLLVGLISHKTKLVLLLLTLCLLLCHDIFFLISSANKEMMEFVKFVQLVFSFFFHGR